MINHLLDDYWMTSLESGEKSTIDARNRREKSTQEPQEINIGWVKGRWLVECCHCKSGGYFVAVVAVVVVADSQRSLGIIPLFHLAFHSYWMPRQHDEQRDVLYDCQTGTV